MTTWNAIYCGSVVRSVRAASFLEAVAILFPLYRRIPYGLYSVERQT